MTAGAPGEARRLLVVEPLAAPGLELLRQAPGLTVEVRTDLDADEVAGALRGAHGLLVRGAVRVDERLLAAADALRAVGRAGVGVDNVDVEAATRRGVAVFNAPTGNTRSAAELTMGLLLSCARGIPGADRAVREGRWEHRTRLGLELAGTTLGIVGLGRIGSAVAARAAPFGMRLLACDPYLETPGRARAARLGADLVGLEELLERSDVVTVHTPLNDETRGMIGAPEVRRMPRGSYLLNAARGGIVDEEALADALREGHLAGAGVDVLSREPPPADHPLLNAPRVVLTPHVGGKTEAATRAVALEIARAMRDALVHGELEGAVNAEALAGEPEGSNAEARLEGPGG